MSFKKIKPLGKRVLVKRAEPTVTKGGILFPDSAQEKPKQGEVIAVGPGEMEDDGAITPLNLKIGDRVLFGAFAGTEVNASEEDDYLLMSEEDVLAVLEVE